LAHRVISLPRSKYVAFGEEQTANSRDPQSRSKMTQSDMLQKRVLEAHKCQRFSGVARAL
jgi:hypothetical protein